MKISCLTNRVVRNKPTAKNDQQQIGTTEPKNYDLSSDAVEEMHPKEETLQSPTENMEVHHHPHKHHSKKWKDYLYEFLMLFLAVTAGFFVENRREYFVTWLCLQGKPYKRRATAELLISFNSTSIFCLLQTMSKTTA